MDFFKKRLAGPMLVLAFSLICTVALFAETWRSTRDLKIENTNDTVKLTIQSRGAPTSNLVEVLEGSALKFALPPTGVLPVAYGGTGSATAAASLTALGIQRGTNTASGGVATVTFATAYSVAPVVIACGSATNENPHVLTLTTTNCTIGTLSASAAVYWIAIGAP